MWDNGKQPIVLPPANLSQNYRISTAVRINSSAHLSLTLASLPEPPNDVIKSICIYCKQWTRLLIRYIPSFPLTHITSFFWLHLCQFCLDALLVWQRRDLLSSHRKCSHSLDMCQLSNLFLVICSFCLLPDHCWPADSLLCALLCMFMLRNSYGCKSGTSIKKLLLVPVERVLFLTC